MFFFYFILEKFSFSITFNTHSLFAQNLWLIFVCFCFVSFDSIGTWNVISLIIIDEENRILRNLSVYIFVVCFGNQIDPSPEFVSFFFLIIETLR